jgi:hypothetical protein
MCWEPKRESESFITKNDRHDVVPNKNRLSVVDENPRISIHGKQSSPEIGLQKSKQDTGL